MKWVEIITLRSPSKISGQFINELLKGVSEFDSVMPNYLIEIKIYNHPAVETDLSIHIYWKSEPGSQDKSPLGLRFADAIKNLGLLNHSVWVETGALEFPQVVEVLNPGTPRNILRRKTLETTEEKQDAGSPNNHSKSGAEDEARVLRRLFEPEK